MNKLTCPDCKTELTTFRWRGGWICDCNGPCLNGQRGRGHTEHLAFSDFLDQIQEKQMRKSIRARLKSIDPKSIRKIV